MNFPVNYLGLNFRLVDEQDAPFILNLRTHKKLAKYISFTDESLDNQIRWIQNYKLREANGEEYYILFEDEIGEPLGVVRMYHIVGDTFTAGSWLVKPDCGELIALISDLFVLELSFNQMKMKKCLIDVRKQNKKIVRYHQKFFKQIGEDEENFYMEMDVEAYHKKRMFLKSILTAI